MSKERLMTTERWVAFNNQTHDGEPYEAPAALAVDPVVLTAFGDQLKLLVLAGAHPEAALPGGLVRPDESAEAAVRRTLRDKAGLGGVRLEQLMTFTDPMRDYRGWIPSVAFVGLVPPGESPLHPRAEWVDARDLPTLAFDHADIVKLAIERLEGKLWWSNVAVGILANSFTATEARHVYDALLGRMHNERTFLRDLSKTGLIEDAATEDLKETAGRPAKLYRFKSADPTWGVDRRRRTRG